MPICLSLTSLLLIFLSFYKINAIKLLQENGELLVFYVKENSAKGTFIGNINIDGFFPPYEIHESQVKNIMIFKDSGIIIVQDILDREKKAFYSFLVVSSTGDTKTIRVNILDQNDNAPKFKVTTLEKIIPENYPVGSKVDLTSAYDPDEGINSIEKFTIMSGDLGGYFGIDFYNGGNGHFYLRLVLIKQLDFETITQYNMVINAADGGSPSLSGSLFLKIIIENANDNAPKFDLSRYIASVKEDQMISETILQVHATDRDAGDAGQLTYFLEINNINSDFFNINPHNGKISLKKTIDYEKKRQLTLNVAVKDNALPYHTSQASLIVDVVDVNDNPPSIDIIWSHRSKEIDVNIEPNSLIAHITVSDLDSVSTHFFLQIINEVPLKIDKILPRMWELKTTDRLKTITTDNITLVLEATDYPPPTLKSLTTISIKITKPYLVDFTFLQRKYVVELQNPISKPNENITVITFSGPWPAGRTDLYMSLDDNSRKLFKIGLYNGHITSTGPIDCGIYILGVYLHSNKPSIKADKAELTIIVKGSRKTNLYFIENFRRIPLNTQVKRDDCPSWVEVANNHCSKDVQYKMEALAKGSDSFQITNTGEICYKSDASLEKSIYKKYFYKVAASEKGSEDATVNVLLVATPPVSYFRILNKDVQITLFSTNNSVPVARVVATFQNNPPYIYYGVIQYEMKIQKGKMNGLIKIDKITGDIYVSEILRLPDSEIVLEIFPYIFNRNIASQVITVTLGISGTQRFTKSLYEFQLVLDHTSQAERIVGQVSLANTSPFQAPVSYYLKESNFAEIIFSIDSTNGLIKAKNLYLLDYIVSLNVVAQLSGGSSCHCQVLVMIDRDPSPPSFTFTSIDVNVWENTTVGTELVQMVPSSSSWSDYYSICYGRFSDWVSIHPRSGQVFLVKKMDREEIPRAIITVELKNKWGSVKSDMDINVLDNNDNPPFCKESIVNMTFKDSSPVGVVKCPLQCTDSDTLYNGNLTYHIKMIFPNGIVSPFRIHILTGCFQVVSSLDKWEKNPLGVYEYSVIISDNGRDGSLQTKVKVNVKVLDTNNHMPYVKSYLAFHVLETASFGTKVGDLLLEDKDLNSSMIVDINDRQYSNMFYTEVVTGRLAVLRCRQMRGIRLGNHSLSLKIKDNGSPPQVSIVNATIIIQDSNNHDPEILFPKENQNISYLCSSVPGSKILTVNATDRDVGWNSRLNFFIKDTKANDIFSLDKWSGIISTKRSPPCTETARLQIIVYDMGYPRRSSFVNIILSSENEKTSSESIAIKKLIFIIPENAQSGTILGSLRMNTWSNLMGVKYLFGGLSPTSQDNVLHINYEDQRLVLLKNEGNLHSRSYPVTVFCHKAIVPPRSFNFYLNLQSNKETKTWPTFLDEMAIIKVKENQLPGTFVKRFLTKNPENNTSIFSLNQPGNFFVLDPFTGILLTFISFDRENMINDEFSIEITATDFGDPNKTSVLPVHVYIEDENDNAPLIISPVNSTIEVIFVESKNESVTRIVAVDLDKGRNGQFNFSIHGQSIFTVEQQTGYIWLIATPTMQIYELNVSVTDWGEPPLTSWILLTFYFQKSETENKISFSENPISMNLNTANWRHPSILGRVTLAPSPSYSNPDVRFQLIAGKFASLFEIDSVKGDIKPSRPVLISEIGAAEIIKLSVIAFLISDESNYDTASLHIYINHGNNHAPSFAKSKYVVKLPEGEAITDFLTVAAHDQDLGIFGRVTYQLRGDVDDQRISIDSKSGKLSCSSLDYLDKKIYNLEVIATDSQGGEFSKNQSAIVRVIVQHSKIQLLEFNSTNFVIYIKENQPDGTILGSITVQRKSQYSKIMYLLNPGHPFLNINSSTGQLSTNRPIDREKTQFLDVTIQAISVVPDSRFFQSAKTTLNIKIIDENDNFPIPYQNPIIIDIFKNTDFRFPLTKLSATDPDLNSNITFRLDLDDIPTKTLSSLYDLEPFQGMLKSRFYDLKTFSSPHILKVLISDNGSPPKTTQVLVHIRMNANPAILNVTPEIGIFRVMENSPGGTFIGQIFLQSNCSTGKSSFIVIDGIHRNLVYMHKESGKMFVSITNTIDREQVGQIILWTQVRCLETDLVGYKNIIINVDDMDDNRPVFSQKEYVAFVLENLPPKTSVVRTSVYDPDEGINSQVEYFIELYSPLDEFSIDSEGMISTNIPLNFHTKSLYNLIIKATSKSTPLLFAECRVTVHIINVNDQRPIFSNSFQSLQIYEDKPVGSLLTTIIAKDSDGSEGISYRIRPRTMLNSTRFLSVAYDSGEIFLSRKIKASDRGRHELDIVADDGKFSSSTILEVDVLDVNDQTPKLLENGNDFIISESMGPGSVLLYLHATDNDFGINGEVSFEISPPIPWLGLQDLQNNTATLYLIAPSKYTEKIQVVGIQLTDKANNPKDRLSSVSTIILLTEISNPHPPQFINGSKGTLKVPKNIALGSKITSLECLDEEDRITYMFNSSLSNNLFHIDSKNGDIFVIEKLQNYPEINFNLTIICQDNGKPQRRTNFFLSFYIEENIQGIPMLSFYTKTLMVEVNETSRYPVLITNIQRGNKLFSEPSSISLLSTVPKYAVYDTLIPEFYVDQLSNLWLQKIKESGSWNTIIRINIKDSERQSIHYLYRSSYMRITVTVKGISSLGSETCVNIDRLTAVIKENEPSTTRTLHLPLWYSDIKYTMNEDDDFILSCNPQFSSNCKIESKVILDFERTEKYYLNLIVTGKTPSKRSCSHPLVVEVNVLDVDEYQPIFTKLEYSHSVPGGVPKLGKVVFKIQATDNDKGRFGLVYYQLSNSQNGHFAILNKTGEIYVKVDFPVPNEFQSRKKRTIGNEQPKTHHRKTFLLNVIASSGERSSTANVRLSILVPFIPEDINPFFSLTAVQMALIAGLPTLVVIICVILAVFLILWKRKCCISKERHSETVYSGSEGNSSYRTDFTKTDARQNASWYQNSTSFHNNNNNRNCLPDVALTQNIYPSTMNSLPNSETQEFSCNSEDNIQHLNNRNISTLSHSSETSSRNGPSSVDFCDSGLGHHKKTSMCYNNNNNQRNACMENRLDFIRHDQDLSSTSSNGYSAIIQKPLQNQYQQSNRFISPDGMQRSIDAFREGPIDHTMVSSQRFLPSTSKSSRSSMNLKNNPSNLELMPLYNNRPVMQYSQGDLRNNNYPYTKPLLPQFDDRSYDPNIQSDNQPAYRSNGQLCQIISVDGPQFCAISHPSGSSSHHETYAQTYSDVTDIDC